MHARAIRLTLLLYSYLKIYYKINLEKTARAAIYSRWGLRCIEGGDYRIAADDGRQRQKSALLQLSPPKGSGGIRKTRDGSEEIAKIESKRERKRSERVQRTAADIE